MTSRQVSKQLKQLEAERMARLAAENDESEEDIVMAPSRSAFAAFADMDDGSDWGDSEDEANETEEQEESTTKQQASHESTSVSAASDESSVACSESSASQKKQKKKRKKRRRRKKAKPSEEASEATSEVSAIDSVVIEGSESDEDEALATSLECEPSLLAVPMRDLCVDNEIRASFGAEALREARGSGRTKLRVQRQPKWFKPRAKWPLDRFDYGGLRMRVMEKGALTLFSLEMSAKFSAVQHETLTAMHNNDAGAMMWVAQQNPFHPFALFRAAEIYIMHGSYEEASDCIERALCRFETAFCKEFYDCVRKGTARLFVREGDDKGSQGLLFLSLLQRHAALLQRRALPVTALACMRLALQLCPQEDPVDALSGVALVAPRAHQTQLLLDLCQACGVDADCETPQELLCAPQRRQLDLVAVRAYAPLGYSTALALHFDERESEATALLLRSLLVFPALLPPLLRVVTGGDSDSTVRHALFTSDSSSNNDMNKLVALYAARSGSLWKGDSTKRWLQATVARATALVDAHAVRADALVTRALRERAFVASVPCRYVRVRAEDLGDMGGTLPREQLDMLLRQFDVQHQDLPLVAGDFNEELQDAGALQAFLLSLLPWVHARQ